MSRLVLIVDDDADIRNALHRALTEEGFSVACAGNGEEALDRLDGPDGCRPAAVILDVRMPVMNGLEFLCYRASMPEVQAVPVLVMTAAGYRDDLFEPFTSCQLMRKPVRLSDLVAALLPLVTDRSIH
jgi:CheY-like chemotaxis protein